jgi:hypothetical protein
VDLEDIQGIALHRNRRQRLARYYLLGFAAGDPRRVLSRLVTDISDAAEPRATSRQHLALTASGLSALGLSQAELAQFPREFRQGMAHPERAAALADAGRNSPEHWQLGGPNNPALDGAWMLFAESRERLVELGAERERLFERFGITWRAHEAHAFDDPQATPLRARRRRDRLPLGELILGQKNAIGERHAGPFVADKAGSRPFPDWSRSRKTLDFGRNGSYLALRKLELCAPDLDGAQVAALLAAEHARLTGVDAPLSPAHRVVSRSRRIGNGLWLMALNTDLRRQFELVTQHAAEAARLEADESRHSFRVCGGAYFFLPGVRALNYLAEVGW